MMLVFEAKSMSIECVCIGGVCIGRWMPIGCVLSEVYVCGGVLCADDSMNNITYFNLKNSIKSIYIKKIK